MLCRKSMFWRAAGVSLVAASMSGCVVVIGTDSEHDGVYWANDYEKGIRDDESALARSVAQRLSAVEQLNEQRIHVTAKGSSVVLDGRVKSRDELMQVIDLASETPGVRKVITHIAVGNDG
ncbi:MAG: BON domain-containing protein [Gammaproteobacteria bacterium]|nr:BON domain-containing protein [Gammaproteobacteria bacterium]